LREIIVVFVTGIGIALFANGVSPRGLSLSRNYFPNAPHTTASGAAQPTNTSPTVTVPATNHNAADGDVAARLKQSGLQTVGREEVERLFKDPQYDQELILFVDARDDRHYHEGHVPGAYQFDRYYPEKYLPEVLPACLSAQKIVVYCSGGKCEDSEFAALALKDAGVPLERLFVFAGGITEWAAKQLPLELDGRKSGRLREEKSGISGSHAQ
jgi:rhodanese-related sulfurtransferase